MAGQTTSEEWDAAWTLSMRKNRGDLSDLIFDEYPVLDSLRKRGKVIIEDGGKEFQEDVMYAKNSGTWFSGYDTVNQAAVDGISAAFFPPRYFSTPVTISLTEETEQDGKKLINAKQKQSMLTVRDSVSASLMGSAGSKEMLGFQDIIADAPTTGTLGGLDRAVIAGWRNQYNTNATVFLTQSVTNVFDGWDQLMITYNACSSGNDQPDMIVCPLDVMADIESSRASMGYTTLVDGSSSTNALGSADDPRFKKAVIFADRDCAADHLYQLNTKYLSLRIMSNLNFAKTPFTSNGFQHAKVGHVVFGGQLTTNNPRRLGVHTNVT
jgi:hypothetical protein